MVVDVDGLDGGALGDGLGEGVECGVAGVRLEIFADEDKVIVAVVAHPAVEEPIVGIVGDDERSACGAVGDCERRAVGELCAPDPPVGVVGVDGGVEVADPPVGEVAEDAVSEGHPGFLLPGGIGDGRDDFWGEPSLEHVAFGVGAAAKVLMEEKLEGAGAVRAVALGEFAAGEDLILFGVPVRGGDDLVFVGVPVFDGDGGE